MKKAIAYIGGLVVAELIRRIFDIIPFEKLFHNSHLDWIIQNRFSIVDVILFAVSLAIVFSIIKTFKFGEKRKSKLERHLERFNTMVYEDVNIKVTWDMYMEAMYDNDPHPYNIKMLCMKHNPPLLMPHGHCQDSRCPNADKYFSKDAIETQIESLLIAERDKFIKK